MPEIIFENNDYLVINKPAGLIVHSDGRFVLPENIKTEPTLVDWIRENYPEIKGVGEPMTIWNKGQELLIDRPGIVHRLDRETSGAMIVVKNQKAFEFFKQAFKDRDIDKTYNAIVWGHVKDDDGVINAPIARSKSDFRKWSAQRGARGLHREAITEYKVLQRFVEDGQKFTLLELHPKTGRTHQIRVHMKYFNHPIICDSLYGEGKPKVLGITRTALHSRRIQFTDPAGVDQVFDAPYPDDFLEVLAKL